MDPMAGELVVPDEDRGSIPRHRWHEVCRHLAVKDLTKREIAKRFGVTPPAITQFSRRHAALIDEMRDRIEDDFVGMWIAKKENRIAAYMADWEASKANNDYGDHFEHIKTRAMILRQVAEEMGDLPPRQSVVVVPVQHSVVGVDVAALE